MADVIHASERAVMTLRHRDAFVGARHPRLARACDGLQFVDGVGFLDAHADAVVRGDAPDVAWPTCPECRRLLDEALDPTFERDRAVAAAWSKVADAVREP
jgi:hypothetical protein